MKVFPNSLKKSIKNRVALYFMLYAFVVGWVFAFFHIVTVPLFTPAGWMMAVLSSLGVVFLLVGLFLWVSGEYGKQLKKQPSILPVKGCYGMTRHPIFSGILFTFTGVYILFTGSYLCIIYFLLLYIAVLFMLRSTEKELIAHHQLRFIYYKNCVPAIIPIPKSFSASYFYPASSGWITNDCLALKDRYVNFFLYRISQNYIAIDTGKNPHIVEEELRRYHISPSQISHVFLTHLDHDHCGGLDLFKEASIYVSSKEPLSKRFSCIPHHRWKRIVSCHDFATLEHMQETIIDTTSIASYLVPGHTHGHMNYVVNGTMFFTGDSLLFQNGRIRPFYYLFNRDHANARLYADYVYTFLQEHPEIQMLISSHSGVLYRDSQQNFTSVECEYPFIKEVFLLHSMPLDEQIQLDERCSGEGAVE
jgi:glyoxylase-like metal-dependent hydrolase (beta-lactamase superfamily II)